MTKCDDDKVSSTANLELATNPYLDMNTLTHHHVECHSFRYLSSDFIRLTLRNKTALIITINTTFNQTHHVIRASLIIHGFYKHYRDPQIFATALSSPNKPIIKLNKPAAPNKIIGRK